MSSCLGINIVPVGAILVATAAVGAMVVGTVVVGAAVVGVAVVGAAEATAVTLCANYTREWEEPGEGRNDIS